MVTFDLRGRPTARVEIDFAGVTALIASLAAVETAFETDAKVLEIALVGLEGGDARGELEAFEGVARGERLVGEVGSGKARGWCRVETMAVDVLGGKYGVFESFAIRRRSSVSERANATGDRDLLSLKRGPR